jgi:aconitase family protein (aconitate hydratase)
MRARAGDPPRTMAQKILAGRAADPTLAGDMIEVKVDQVVLARSPMRAFAEGLQAGLKKTSVEVAIAYDTACVTERTRPVSPDVLGHGLILGRPGVGYPGPVHLERFASPARLCVTDEPRLAGVGGIGMLSVVVPPGQLGQALAQGEVWLRPPRSVQVLLSGRMRPFVCARDVALELMRRGLADVVRRVEEATSAPVVLEFAGAAVRLLSVGERAVISAMAPQVGASGAVFVSDERTEVFLRDQRRSKAHRALAPDAGAPCDDVVNIDLGAVDPLLLDEAGRVRAVRDLAGKPVAQVLLGGDSGVTLRDLFAAATLLKSKRVPPRVDFLLSIPSRQMLEVLSSSGALTDLLATGARLVEPDARVMSGHIYPPPWPPTSGGGLSVRTCDPEPQSSGSAPFVVASSETLAYAVASGEMGDPRSFKRPVRVTVPRALPTDDVLIVRERRAGDLGGRKGTTPAVDPAMPWRGPQTLEVVLGAAFVGAPANGKTNLAVLCCTLDEVRQLAQRAPDVAGSVRAVLAPFIPSGLVALFSGVGIAAIQIDAGAAKGLPGQKLALPAPSSWAEKNVTPIAVGSAKHETVGLRWLARGAERAWTSAGTARPGPRTARG